MALVTVGNSHVGNKYLYPYEYETEDDDGEVYEEVKNLELSIEDCFEGYFTQLATATYENKIKLHIYHRCPTDPEYDDYVGRCNLQVVPVVYRCSSAGVFLELINNNVELITRPENFTGWIDCEVTLKRNFKAGEYVYAEFFAHYLNPVWNESSSSVVGIPIERLYYSGSHDAGYYVTAIKNGTILSNTHKNLDAYNYSLYFQYYNSPLRTDYVRSVSSNGRLNSLLARKSKLKRNKTERETVSEKIAKRFCVFRVCYENENIKDFSARNLKATRNFLENETVQESSVRSVEATRELKADCYIEDFAVRSAGFFHKIFEDAGLFDVVVRFFVFICKVFSVGGGSDNLGRSAKYKREENSENKTFASVVAGRLIFRAVATVIGVWDWPKSKIRNENCVAELFCPITDVLEIECKI